MCDFPASAATVTFTATYAERQLLHQPHHCDLLSFEKTVSIKYIIIEKENMSLACRRRPRRSLPISADAERGNVRLTCLMKPVSVDPILNVEERLVVAHGA